MRRLARRPPGADHPAILESLREVVGGGHGDQPRHPVLLDLGCQRVAEVAEEHAGHQVHLVVLDHLAQLAQRHVGPALAVLDDQLHLAARHRGARLVEVHGDAVDHVFSRLRRHAGEIGDEADLDRGRLGRGRPGADEERENGESEHDDPDPEHRRSSRSNPATSGLVTAA